MPIKVQGFGSDGTTQKCWQCPKGHMLEPWKSAGAGSCDGCKQAVGSGERVMDCRLCNWYLCERCHPQERDVSFWDSVTSALETAAEDVTTIASGLNKEIEAFVNVVTCHAPDKEELEIAEVDIRRCDDEPEARRGAQAREGAPDAGTAKAAEESENDDEDVPEPETGVAPQSPAIEENLMEFEHDDLVDLSEASPAPPAAAQDLTDIFDAAPPAQNADADLLVLDAAPPARVAAADIFGAAPPPAQAAAADIFDIVPPTQPPGPPRAQADAAADIFDVVPAAQPTPPPAPAAQGAVADLLDTHEPAAAAAAPAAIPSADRGNDKTGAGMDLMSFDTTPSSAPPPARQAASMQGQNLIEVF